MVPARMLSSIAPVPKPDIIAQSSSGSAYTLESEMLGADVDMWNDLFNSQGLPGYTDDISEALAWSAQFIHRPQGIPEWRAELN